MDGIEIVIPDIGTAVHRGHSLVDPAFEGIPLEELETFNVGLGPDAQSGNLCGAAIRFLNFVQTAAGDHDAYSFRSHLRLFQESMLVKSFRA